LTPVIKGNLPTLEAQAPTIEIQAIEADDYCSLGRYLPLSQLMLGYQGRAPEPILGQ
jgi:hypothetical protein